MEFKIKEISFSNNNVQFCHLFYFFFVTNWCQGVHGNQSPLYEFAQFWNLGECRISFEKTYKINIPLKVSLPFQLHFHVLPLKLKSPLCRPVSQISWRNQLSKYQKQPLSYKLTTSNDQRLEKCILCVLMLYYWDLHFFFWADHHSKYSTNCLLEEKYHYLFLTSCIHGSG